MNSKSYYLSFSSAWNYPILCERLYIRALIGFNSGLDTIQAVILLGKLKIFPEELPMRDQVAADYRADLSAYYKTQQINEGITSAWAQYTLIVDNRFSTHAKLKEAGIPSAV